VSILDTDLTHNEIRYHYQRTAISNYKMNPFIIIGLYRHFSTVYAGIFSTRKTPNSKTFQEQYLHYTFLQHCKQ